jgi:hypothetical protein
MASRFFGLEGKISQLREIIGCSTGGPSDHELEMLLKDSSWSVQAAAAAHFDGDDGAHAPRAPEADSIPRDAAPELPEKRQRVTSPTQGERKAQHSSPWPFCGTAAGPEVSEAAAPGVLAAMQAMLAPLASSVKLIVESVTAMRSTLPTELAKAVRQYDEDEARRLAEAAEETELERQIARCRTCVEVGKLKGFSYTVQTNEIVCLDCQRYGHECPGKLIRGARNFGVFDGDCKADREHTPPRSAPPLCMCTAHPACNTWSGQYARVSACPCPCPRVHSRHVCLSRVCSCGPASTALRGITARHFKTVKHALLRHARSGAHSWCEVHAFEVAANMRRANATGLACGRLVLQLTKEHDSNLSYERRIANLRVLGVDVGNKNHSKEFCAGLKRSMWAVTTATIQTALTTAQPATLRPPAFAALADKATVDRLTGQMHGTLVMLDGRLTALFLSVLVVPAGGGGGDGLAQLQVDTYTGGKPLTLTFAQMREQLTGQAYDGQYQGVEQRSFTGLSVPVHLADKLGINAEWVLSRCLNHTLAHRPAARARPAHAPPCVPLRFGRWDPAHRIELAMGEIRKDNSSVTSFYVQLSAKVAEAQSTYLHGKGFERVMVAWKKLNERVREHLRPGSVGTVCTTRFCASERKVYKAFFRNLTVFIQDGLDNKVDMNELNNVRSITFVAHLAGTIDLLRPLKDLSLRLQAVNNLPWELDTLTTEFISEIERLEADLRAGDLSRELATRDSNGKAHPAFEFLKAIEANAKQSKLQLKASDGTVLAEVDLVTSAGRRGSRSGTAFASASDEWQAAVSNLADLARAIRDKVDARLANTPREERWIARMASALDLRALAYPSGAIARASVAKATAAAAKVIPASTAGVYSGDRIEVLVSDAGETELWWPASVGGPATGAGAHGIVVVYDANVAQDVDAPVTSRVCFHADGQLLDVDEMATWRWRPAPAVPPAAAAASTGAPAALPAPAAPANASDEVTAAANAAAVAAAAAAAALNRGDAAGAAERAAVFQAALEASRKGIAEREEFDALLLLLEWMESRFDAAQLAAVPLPAAPPPAAPTRPPRRRPLHCSWHSHEGRMCMGLGAEGWSGSSMRARVPPPWV